MGILECPSEEVVFISTDYTSIHQMVRCVYTKANVWCKPQGKQQRLGKEKSPTSVSPCTVSSELLPADSSGEHGIQVTAPGDGGWTADRTSLPLWWEAQWCCRHRMDGQTDGWHKSWGRIQALRKKKMTPVQPITFSMQAGGIWSWLRIGREVFPALHI